MSKFNWSNPSYKIKKDGTQYTKVWRDKNHVFFKKVVDTDNINSMHSDSKEPTWEQILENSNTSWLIDPVNLFQVKLELIAGGVAVGLPNGMSIYNQLVQYYHPDHNNNSCTEVFELIREFKYMI